MNAQQGGDARNDGELASGLGITWDPCLRRVRVRVVVGIPIPRLRQTRRRSEPRRPARGAANGNAHSCAGESEFSIKWDAPARRIRFRLLVQIHVPKPGRGFWAATAAATVTVAPVLSALQQAIVRELQRIFGA
jgi:hypothetical protein